jgi:D-alanyl-lipoteichoic acid acyltransferase DltB (MBOAT superfamily)
VYSNVPQPSSLRTFSIALLVIGVLGYYKIRTSGQHDFITDVAMPLGLSFYAFRCVHYLIERYKGNIPQQAFTTFCCYLWFLPTLVVGPIHRYPQFQKDLRFKRWDATMLSDGLRRILYGYVKIVVLGNYLVSVQLGRVNGDLEVGPLYYYLEIVRNGLNLYFQFSGFSDIAIGFALLHGYRVMENFNWPYFKRNISDFWRAWHISLTSWCRDYVYTVVFSVTRNSYLGIIATLITIGLWHEISWRYLEWGIYHGLGIVTWQLFQRVRSKLPTVNNPVLRRALDGASIVVTVHFVWFGFVLVNQPDLASAFSIYRIVLFSWI